MRTGLTKKQMVPEVFYNAKDPIAEVTACRNRQPGGFFHRRCR